MRKASDLQPAPLLVFMVLAVVVAGLLDVQITDQSEAMKVIPLVSWPTARELLIQMRRQAWLSFQACLSSHQSGFSPRGPSCFDCSLFEQSVFCPKTHTKFFETLETSARSISASNLPGNFLVSSFHNCHDFAMLHSVPCQVEMNVVVCNAALAAGEQGLVVVSRVPPVC